ncbi:MAG: GNAT family N-acetyltransferase [Clostridia bacterium]
MSLKFKKISDFDRGILHRLLADAYSFDERCGECWEPDWRDFDNFFFDHITIADQCGLITTLNDEPIGHISWDPRHAPEYIEIGHNCIATKYKGNGYGKIQLSEALHRIQQYEGLKKIVVTTNGLMIPAQRNYESVGFKLVQRRKNVGIAAFSGETIDYEIVLCACIHNEHENS